MNGITRFKWWWGWNCGPIETWLEDMEAQGWRLERVGFLGAAFFFLPAQPGRARYCVDYQPRPGASWFELLADDGWRVIPAGAGWQICRKAWEDERPELFNDWDSLIARNRRLLAILLAIFAPCMAALAPNLANLARRGIGDALQAVILAEMAVLVAVYGFFFVRILSANRLLKRRKALRGN